MCLVVDKDTKPQTAEQDLTFFKLVKLIPNGYGKLEYRTYFRDKEVVLGETYTDGGENFKIYPEYPHPNCHARSIHEGGYHLFVSYKDASDFGDGMRDFILKAVVPKGTKFIMGTFRTEWGEVPSIVTKSVRYEFITK